MNLTFNIYYNGYYKVLPKHSVEATTSSIYKHITLSKVSVFRTAQRCLSLHVSSFILDKSISLYTAGLLKTHVELECSRGGRPMWYGQWYLSSLG